MISYGSRSTEGKKGLDSIRTSASHLAPIYSYAPSCQTNMFSTPNYSIATKMLSSQLNNCHPKRNIVSKFINKKKVWATLVSLFWLTTKMPEQMVPQTEIPTICTYSHDYICIPFIWGENILKIRSAKPQIHSGSALLDYEITMDICSEEKNGNLNIYLLSHIMLCEKIIKLYRTCYFLKEYICGYESDSLKNFKNT